MERTTDFMLQEKLRAVIVNIFAVFRGWTCGGQALKHGICRVPSFYQPNVALPVTLCHGETADEMLAHAESWQDREPIKPLRLAVEIVVHNQGVVGGNDG